MCLAVKSGPNESANSLKTEFNRIWSGVRSLKIDPYSRNDYSTLFRVQFDIPVPLVEKLSDPESWPTRMSIRPWRGNPKIQLRPLEERQEQRRIYVGNLGQAISMETVAENMKVIYRQEIDDGIIEDIEAHLNFKAWERQQKMKEDNIHHILRKSACVVVKAAPGQSIMNIDLRFDHGITVRPWNGPVPTDQTPRQSRMGLMWS